MNGDGVVNQVFTVPANEEGTYFMHLAKKYLNTANYDLRRRGRSPKKGSPKDRGFTRLDHATKWGIYLMAKYENEKGQKVREVTGVSQSVWLDHTRTRLWKDYGKEKRIAELLGSALKELDVK
jgi:hypothetical protein